MEYRDKDIYIKYPVIWIQMQILIWIQFWLIFPSKFDFYFDLEKVCLKFHGQRRARQLVLNMDDAILQRLKNILADNCLGNFDKSWRKSSWNERCGFPGVKRECSRHLRSISISSDPLLCFQIRFYSLHTTLEIKIQFIVTSCQLYIHFVLTQNHS